jgi:DNA-binding XRE family transcriptional regulator
MVTSAQLRAARAYLDWTMDKAAAVSGLNRRTIIRLENDDSYAEAQPPSLRKLVAIYASSLPSMVEQHLAV